MTLTRRQLFDLLRGPSSATDDETEALEAPESRAARAAREAQEAPPETHEAHEAPAPEAATAFSLDAFYANRTADRSLPVFEVRAIAAAPTTRVGIGRIAGAALPVPSAPAVTPIPPALVPEVLAHRCLATSSFCSVCVERCPLPGAIVVEHGRPRVEAARCDGCGLCVATCPAPILAFALVPRRPPST